MFGYRSTWLRVSIEVILLLLAVVVSSPAQSRILIYTRNYTPDNKGFVHDNIAASVASLQRIAADIQVQADVSDDPTVFTPDNLKRYRVLIFSNSNNEAFATEEQREAFKRFIEGGGGWVGIHSASGSERRRDWFAQMVGGRFLAHPKEQVFQVHVADRDFTATKGLQDEFQVRDECYFIKPFATDLHVVLDTDRTKLNYAGFSLKPEDFSNTLPLAWWHEFDGGREFYIALGHDQSNYSDPMFLTILERAILWAMRR